MSPPAVTVFDYPSVPHVRRHGPEGYLNYKHYKPWLRDELLDFGAIAFAEHLEVQPDGIIRGLTRWGEALIDACALNRPDLAAFRRDMQMLLNLLVNRRGDAAALLRKRYFGYPDDLPDLTTLRPPGGNSQPEGIAASCFERRRRGELPDTY